MKNIILSVLLYLLIGCGGGDSTSTDTTSDTTSDHYTDSKFYPYGTFRGEVALNGQVMTVLTIIGENPKRYFIIAANSLEVGSYEYDANQNIYNSINDSTSNYQRDTLSIWNSATESEDTYLTYTYDDIPSPSSWEINTESDRVEYNVISDQYDFASDITRLAVSPSSIEYLEGQFVTNFDRYVGGPLVITWDIDTDGLITAQSTDGCTYNGIVSIENENINVYGLTMDIEGCDRSGNYEGLVIASEIEDGVIMELSMVVNSPLYGLLISASRNQ